MPAPSGSTRPPSPRATWNDSRPRGARPGAAACSACGEPTAARNASAEPGQTLRVTADSGQDGQRLDTALAELCDASRSQVRRWIEAGRVTLNGIACRASRRVQAGDEIEAWPPADGPVLPEAEAIPLAILHEDASILVLDKPAGLVVHPAPGHPAGTLVNALLHHCRELAGVGGALRPGIVHRLDQGTSGLLVVAKTDAAHQALVEQFHDHRIERIYDALVRGVPGRDAGRVEGAVGRHPVDRKRMSLVARGGRAAATGWKVRRRWRRSGISWLEVLPETGRTHQIRVHLSSAGWPLVGDPVYGRARSARAGRGLDRPALHARVLGFRHPDRGRMLRFEAPWPEDLRDLARRLDAAEGASLS